jgi:DNA-binding FadR family transcriptional regulator
MGKQATRTRIETAAETLRAIVLETPEGALVGSEEALIARLGCSRPSVRQVARLLEREGFLRVRRGIGGGYFGARPDAGTIETAVSAYLTTLRMDPSDVTAVASALWVEALRKAAVADQKMVQQAVAQLLKRLDAIADDATFELVSRFERDLQTEIFRLANSGYIELIFNINVAFSLRSPPPVNLDGPAQRAFVARWRDAKRLELNALLNRDEEFATLAGHYSRKIWHQRIWPVTAGDRGFDIAKAQIAR